MEYGGKTVFELRDVFTPTKPARVAFVEREEINDRLVNALTTPGRQVVVYGHSGMGKTTLLVNKLTQLYERHITTRCMKGMKFEQLLLDAFDQLEPFYCSERVSAKKSTTGVDLGATYKAIQAKLSVTTAVEASEKQIRILPPQLTAQMLGRLLGAQSACWILEDFHKMDASEKQSLAQLMKVFMDLSDEYSSVKIVAIGAVDTARQVVDYDPEMRNRVAEINVSLMSDEEIGGIIDKGEAALSVRFDRNVRRQVVKHSNGLPSVCHHLCLNMCDSAGIVATSRDGVIALGATHLEKALKVYVDEASDSIKHAFGKALKQRKKAKFNNAELIIAAMIRVKEHGAARNEILRKIRESEAAYPEANLKYLLPKLCTQEYGGVIRYDATSGVYSFSDPIYRAYALATYSSPSSSDATFAKATDVVFDEIQKILVTALQERFKQGKMVVKVVK